MNTYIHGSLPPPPKPCQKTNSTNKTNLEHRHLMYITNACRSLWAHIFKSLSEYVIKPEDIMKQRK